jgi:serine/threonine protein kinase
VTGLGETKGTLGLMAPEQRLGMTVDARADVFGLGALAYELVTGVAVDLDVKRVLSRRAPIGPPPAAEAIEWPHLRPVRAVRPDAPVELEAILWRALAFEPAARHASCGELEAELAVVMDTHGWIVTDRDIAAWLATELAMTTIGLPAATARVSPVT